MTVKQTPELVTRGVALIQGREHSPDDAARDSVIPGRIEPELAALTIAWGSGFIQLCHIDLLIF